MSGASGGGGLLSESSRRRRSLRFTDSPRPSRGAVGLPHLVCAQDVDAGELWLGEVGSGCPRGLG